MADNDIDIDALSDGILARLKKSLGRGGADPGGELDDEFGGASKVPMHRFRQVIAERNQARQDLEEISGQLTQLQQGYQQQVDALKAEAADQVKGIGQRHAEDLELVDLGLRDPLGRKALRDAWEAQPKDARGKSAVDWWKSTLEARQAHAADPEKAAAPDIPRVLSGYVPALEDGKAGGAGARSPNTGKPPGGPAPRTGVNVADIKPDVGLSGLLGALREQNA